MDVIRVPVFVPDSPAAMRIAFVFSVYFFIRLLVATYLFIRRLIQG